MKFSRAIREWRLCRGLTARAAAVKTGVNRRTWENWEQGKTVPSPFVRAALAREMEGK